MAFFDFLKPVAKVAGGADDAFFNFIHPIANAGKGIAKSTAKVAGIGVEDIRAGAGLLTGNNQATQAALQRGRQDINQAIAIPQAVPRGFAQLYQSATGKSTATASNPFEKALYGSEPVQSLQKQYKDVKQQTGSSAQAASTVGLSFLSDALPLISSAEGAKAIIKKSPTSEAAGKITGLKPENIVNNNEAGTLSDYAQRIMKRDDNGNRISPKDNPTELIMQARNAAKTAGIDVTSGSSIDIHDRISSYLEARDNHIAAKGILGTRGGNQGASLTPDELANLPHPNHPGISSSVNIPTPNGILNVTAKDMADLAKATNSSDVRKVIGDTLPQDIVDRVAPAIAGTKDPNIIRNILDKSLSNPRGASAGQDIAAPGAVQSSPANASETNPAIRQALDLATQKVDTRRISVDENAKNFKGLARDIRGTFSGEVNAQKQSVANLADVLKRVAPDEQHGIYWYREAGGDAAKLQSWLDNPKLAQFKPEIEQALNLSPQAKQVSTALDEYYQKIGQNAKEQGSLGSIVSDYGNKRLYQQADKPKGIGSVLNPYTSASKGRKYSNVAEAIENGYIPSSTNASDVAAVHGSELARANATRNLADNMRDAKIGKYFHSGSVPQGWAKIDSLGKTGSFIDKEGVARTSSLTFAVPEGLAKGLKAITEPDFLANVDSLRGLAKYQGLVKTVDLSFSLFHHITLAAQALYQTKGGLSLIGKTDQLLSLKNPDFAALENDFVKNTGITTKVSNVQDIMRGLVGNEEKGIYGKATNIPGIKQALDVAEKNANLLFDKGQRWLKVNDYGMKVTKWVAKHPNATNEEVSAAKAGFAREVNSAYGGLNWQALGISKTEQSVLRNVLFAPDWTVSNVELARQLLPKSFGGVGGTASAAARSHIFTALAGGLVATEAINKAITGHFTNENPKGHKYEVEVAPNTYVSIFRGGIGDITKLAGNIQDRGLAQGSAQFAQGKTTPVVRTALGLGSGSQYTGQSITNPNDNFAQKLIGEAKYIGQSAAPVPLGVSATAKYVSDTKKTGQPTNPLVAATLGAGLGRYSKTSNGLSNRQQAYVQQLSKQGAPKAQVNAATDFFLTLKTTSQDRTKADKAITAALVKGDQGAARKAAQDYNNKLADSFQGWVKKYGQYSNKDLEKAYNGNKIKLTSTSIKGRIKSIKENPLYGATVGGQ